MSERREEILALARVGTIFRCLAAMGWTVEWLAHEWLDRPLAALPVYHAEIAEAMQAI